MSIATSAPTPTPKVAIWRCVKAGYRDIFQNLGAVLTAATVPFLLTLGFGFALREAALDGELAWVGAILFMLPAGLFQLALFRLLLLRSALKRPSLLPTATRRLLLYFGYNLLLLLLFAPTYLVRELLEGLADLPAMASHLSIVGLYLLGLYVMIRLGFVLPWVAIDAPERFAASWRATRGNGLRIIATGVMAGLPLLALLFIAGILLVLTFPESTVQLQTGQLSSRLFWIDFAITQILSFSYYAVSTAALAEAFCQRTGWVSDRQDILERFE